MHCLVKKAGRVCRAMFRDVWTVGLEWPPRRESNPYLTLRRRVHYPLCYEEVGAHFTREGGLPPVSFCRIPLEGCDDQTGLDVAIDNSVAGHPRFC